MQFKTLALATTSLVALGLAVAPAQADGGMMGRVELDLSHYWDDWQFGSEGSSFEDEYVTTAGRAMVNIDAGDGFYVQPEIFGGYSLDDDDGRQQFGNAGFGIHFHHRDPEHHLIGVFGGLGRAASGGEGWSGVTQLAGIQGQYYFDRWTIGGSVGYWDADDINGLLGNAAFARAEARFYPRDNVKLTAAMKYIDGEISLNDYDAEDADGFDYLARLDYMIGRNVGLFVELAGRNATVHNEFDDDSELDVFRANFGFSFYLGSDEKQSFMYHDRMGTSVQLPDFDEIRFPEAFNNN